MNSRRFKYTHWLRIDSENEKLQWSKLKEYKDNHECSMTVFYYDYNPLIDKVIKLDCNQSYDELDLEVDSKNEGSFKKIKARPTNSTPYNRSIYSFFEQYLSIKIESSKAKDDIKSTQLPVNTLEEFSELQNVEVLDELLKRNGWQLVKIPSDRKFKYQLYFGEGKQVDNRYEYGYAKFDYKSRIMDRLQRLIDYEIKNADIDMYKFLGRKLNSFGAKYELISGEQICIDAECIGVVLGINDGKVDLFDIKKTMKERFFSISIEDFKKSVSEGFYKVNRNMLSNYEKLEIRRYIKNKLDKFAELCGDWDYRNIDMTDSHLESIDIKGNTISISCEKYSTKLDEYVSCSAGEIKDKNLVREFGLLDLTNREKVLSFISEINNYINYDKVDNDLDTEEQKSISELQKDNCFEQCNDDQEEDMEKDY